MSRHPRYPNAYGPAVGDEAHGEDIAEADERPSKSARKRAAHAAQALGERLIGLKEADLVKLPLPDELREAVRAARRIKARGGLARQKQYIGKLMRDVDPLPIETALDALR
jgi:ribosome-associated protein